MQNINIHGIAYTKIHSSRLNRINEVYGFMSKAGYVLIDLEESLEEAVRNRDSEIIAMLEEIQETDNTVTDVMFYA